MRGGLLKPLKSSSRMTSGQKYEGKGNSATSTQANGSDVVPTASKHERAAILQAQMAANPFGSLLSMPTLTSISNPVDDQLQVTALRFYRDEQLERLQEEYRFCKEGTDRRPDMDFVQATLNDIVRLNKMIESLAIGFDASCRVSGSSPAVLIN